MSAVIETVTPAEVAGWSALCLADPVRSAFAPDDPARGWPDVASLAICLESPDPGKIEHPLVSSTDFADNDVALDAIGCWIVTQRDLGRDVIVYGSWRGPGDRGTHIHVKSFEGGRVRQFANLHLTTRESVAVTCSECGSVDRNRPDEPPTTTFAVDACYSYERGCDLAVEARIGYDRYRW